MPPPAPNLTSEQWIEVNLAVQFGLSNAAWEGIDAVVWTELTREQKKLVLATLKENAERQVAASGAHPSVKKLNDQRIARFDLEGVEREAEQEQAMRALWLNTTGTEKQKARRFASWTNEILSQAIHFDAGQIRSVERRLAAKNLPPLSSFTAKLNRQREGILRRGKIRNDDEYSIVKEIVCDTSSDVTEEDRVKFEHLLFAYEHRKS